MGGATPPVNLSSASYLGLQHASAELRPWTQLTLGGPAALVAYPGEGAMGETLAALQGCERVVVGPSTFHLFWDLFGLFSTEGVAVYVDAGAYPVACWGVERAAGNGVPVRRFSHHDPDALRRQLETDASLRLRPLVVADGFCPSCGEPAPIAAYLDAARVFGGQLILDDTQALGIMGHSPGPDAPYGRGGGGSLRWHGLEGPDVLLISSMAKGFGVPLAVLAGSAALVRWFESESETRIHCSPPSRAVIHGAEHALAINQSDGDALRLRLAERVEQFRTRIQAAGLSVHGGLFPMQTLATPPEVDSARLHERLEQQGIRTLLIDHRTGQGPRVMFLLTSRLSSRQIDHAVAAVKQAVAAERMR